MYEKYEKLVSKHGLTTYKVCKDTGIERSTISRWKNGAYTPKVDKLLILAKYFDVPLEYFLEE